ncbi:hypothetical protein GQ54DRAFT_303888 [Martensiomyces pterosporus]|nr:hypothetical protein GQ54DRAFT_303888 [Martensiomyces pterosporus]
MGMFNKAAKLSMASPGASLATKFFTRVFPVMLGITQYALILSTLALFSSYELKTANGHHMFPAIHIVLRVLTVALVARSVLYLIKKMHKEGEDTIETSKRKFFTFLSINLIVGGVLCFDPMLKPICDDSKMHLARHTKHVFYVSLIFIALYNSIFAVVLACTGGGFQGRKDSTTKQSLPYMGSV